MSWHISLCLSLWTVSNSLMCSLVIVLYSLTPFFLPLFCLFHSSVLVSQSPHLHKPPSTNTHSFITPPGLTLGLSLSLISPPVQSHACSSCPCSPPQHADQSWVSGSSMTAFKAIPVLLFEPWNIHYVQAPVHVFWMGICACVRFHLKPHLGIQVCYVCRLQIKKWVTSRAWYDASLTIGIMENNFIF